MPHFPALAQWLGVWKLFVIVTLLHLVTSLMVSFLVFIPQRVLFLSIYTCLAVCNIISITAFPVLLRLIKQASPFDSVMGRINGLAASAGTAARTVSLLASGFLYSAGRENANCLLRVPNNYIAVCHSTNLRPVNFNQP